MVVGTQTMGIPCSSYGEGHLPSIISQVGERSRMLGASVGVERTVFLELPGRDEMM